LAQRRDGAAGNVDAEVGTDQLVLQLLQGRRIELALGQQARDGGAELLGGALEAAREALPPADFLRAVVHCAPVIAVSK
jgi:hypothetical protein